MIAFDANFLSLALIRDVRVAVDPTTKKVIEKPTERIDLLMAELDSQRAQILIPTPALTEFLVLAGSDSSLYLDQIHKLPRFVIRDFTERAAIEVAQAIRKALDSGDEREGVEATWAKVNFDRQIVAIAKVEPGCSALYSTDRDVAKHAEKMTIACIHLADLPLPPELQASHPQLELPLNQSETPDERET